MFQAETELFSSEKSEARGKVAIATLTSGEDFAAEKRQFMAEEYFGMSSRYQEMARVLAP